MKKIARNCRPGLYLAVLLIYLAWAIMGYYPLEFVFAALLAMLVLQAISGASRSSLVISLVLFVLGAACLFYSGASFREWLSAVTSNGGLVVLFISLPLFSIVLTYDDYLPAISKVLRHYIRSAAGLNILTSWIGYLLGAIINLAAVSILHTLLEKDAALYQAGDDFYRALARSNIAAVFWAPNYMSVATVLNYTNLSWLAIAPLGFLLSCFLTVLISLSLLMPSHKHKTTRVTETVQREDGAGKDLEWGPLLRLLSIYLGLITIVGLFNYFTKLQILTIVAVTAILFPLAAAVIQRKLYIYRCEIANYYHHKLVPIKNEILLFASVGFFGKALEITGLGSTAFSFFHLTGITSPNLAVFVLIALLAVLSFVGVHPIVTISALATSLGAASFGLTSLSYAYTLLIGYCLGVLISPFSAIALVLSGVTQKSPWVLAPKMNFLFALAVAVIFSLVLPMI